MSEPLEVHDPATLIHQFIALTTIEDGSNTANEFTLILGELITEGKMSLLEFIQLLGPTLTSDKDSVRSKAVHCLSSTLTNLEPNTATITMKDVNVLIDFLLSKFDDNPSLQYCLRLIDSLIVSKNFKPSANDNLQKILQRLNKQYYTPRSHLAKVRYYAFKVLQSLLLNHKDYITINHYQLFTETFIHVATGEKDPRNLLISFQLNSMINKSFSQLDPTLVEQLFDVCFCYFPITFTPPPNDPYGITSEQLKTGLRNAIASQSLYAKDLFPSLFEKLTSTNPTIRNDVLITLLECIESYSQETIVQYWLSIWNAVKFEILHNEVTTQLKPNEDYLIPPNYITQYGDDSEEKTLLLVLDLFTKILDKFEDNYDALKSYLDIVITELTPKLKGLKEKSYKHSIIILSVLASCNESSFLTISKFLFSTDIWGKYIDNETITTIEHQNEPLNTSKQRDLIDSFGYMFIAYDILASNTNLDDSFTQTNSLFTHKDHLLIFMGQLLQSSSLLEKTLKCKLIQQLTKLIRLPEYLNPREDLLVITYFNDNLISTIDQEKTSWDTDIVLREIVLNMKKLSNNDVIISMFIEQCLPNILNHLTADFPSYPKILNLLSELVFNYRMLETLSIRLLGRLTDASTFAGESQFGKLIIDTLVKLIINSPESILKVNFESWYKNFIPRFLTSIVNHNIDSMDYGTIEACGEFLGLVIRLTHKLKHQFIINDYMTRYHGTSFESMNKAIIISNRVLSNIDKSVDYSPDYTSIIGLLQQRNGDEYLRLSYLQTLAIIMNKFTKGIDEEYLEELYGNLTLIKQVELFAWVIKGLVMKLDPLGVKFLLKLVTKLKEESSPVAKAFNIIYIDLPNFIPFHFPNYSNGSGPINDVRNLNVKPLYKQFTFEQILPELIEGYTSTRNTTYLVALSLVLNNLPSSIYQPHLKQILPLIMNSLVLNSPMLIKASLMTLEMIIAEDSLVMDQLDTIVPRLLSLSLSGSAETRTLSLKCIYNLFNGFQPREKLFKYKQQTLTQLIPVLDDRKRHIRKIACDIRQELYEMDV
ncbi:uncharacterized protein KQ657_004526 [Scheffersomyces spartinae]|uniref:MMS19 nucleotide excision repair protein n=1 Tax=Scheffersomyces spartinae TaxID=45513 RepID=A0A9P7VAD9_9ASCO|nr:uncharacterized protein KQ657_004526 [Scheffersomyces spartinae]KAG7194314.1 hypothetical protein KQ657_004526 [Scheffersomyces spartinae]